MLGTLLKYEFKAVGRVLLPLFGAWIVVAIMLGLSLASDGTSDPNEFMIVISGVLYGFFTIAAVVITAIILIQRFYKNLLGNEGYFMFALPVSTGQHLSNKILSGTAWTFIGMIFAVLTGIAIAVSIEGFVTVFDDLKFLVGDIQIMINRSGSSVFIILEALILVLVGIAQAIAKIYAAISIGHQWSNHRVLGAILAYIVISMIEGILTGILENIWFGQPIEWYYNMSGVGQTHILMLTIIAGCGALLAIYWFISWKLLDKRLNLE